jgi:hypothetical protein
VDIAWEWCGRFVGNLSQNFVACGMAAFFQSVAGKSTVHHSREIQSELAFVRFSTNPQRSSQQQEVFFS